MADARLEENRDPGADWVSTNDYAFLPTYCVTPQGKRRVAITLPDGTVERFTLTLKPACKLLIRPAEMEPA